MALIARRLIDDSGGAVAGAVARRQSLPGEAFRVGTGGRRLAFDVWAARRLREDAAAWNGSQEAAPAVEPDTGPGTSELVPAIPRGGIGRLSSTVTVTAGPERMLRENLPAYAREWEAVGTEWNVRRLKAAAAGGLENLDWPRLLEMDLRGGARTYSPDADLWDMLVPGRSHAATDAGLEGFRTETLDAMHREFAAGRPGEEMAIASWGGIDPPASPFRGMFEAGLAARVAFSGTSSSAALDAMRGADWFGMAASGEMDTVLVCGRRFPTGRTVSGMVLDRARPAADPFGG